MARVVEHLSVLSSDQNHERLGSILRVRDNKGTRADPHSPMRNYAPHLGRSSSGTATLGSAQGLEPELPVKVRLDHPSARAT
jgi:hypothetical protein